MIHFRLFAAHLAIGVLTGQAAFAGQPAPAGEPIVPSDKVIQVFNGESLDGLYTWLKDTQYEDPGHVFRVTDGLLHITGDGLGAVITKAAYRNYHLVLEYRWGEQTWHNRKDRTKDSGLLIHSVGADGGYNGTWMPSLECQIIEGGVGDFILVSGNDEQGQPVPLSITCEVARDRDGEFVWKKAAPRETFDLQNRRRVNWYGRDPDWKDELGFRGPHDLDSPGQKWTRMDVVADGGHVQVYVNGTLANEAFEVHPAHGRIQLQTELAEIFVRRWELYPLDEAPSPAAARNEIVPEAAQLERVWNAGAFTEGVAVGPDGAIYFSDITRDESPGKVMKFDPRSTQTTVYCRDSGKSNGLMFDARGRLIAACGANHGRRALCEITSDGEVRVLVGGYQGQRFNAPNDLVIHPDGSIYFSDPRYVGPEPMEMSEMSVYRYDPASGSVVRVTHDIEKPNGVIVSSDGKTLYVAETNNGTSNIQPGQTYQKGRMTMNAFPIQPDGTLGGKRVLVDFGEKTGVDGMTVDASGNVYAAVRAEDRFGIVVFNPEGDELGYIATPELPTNCCFGIGNEAHTLYVTAGAGLYRIELNATGFHPARGGTEAESVRRDGRRGEWISLFDGKSLKGWKVTKFGGEGEVAVEDGRIVLPFGNDMTGIHTDRKLPTTSYEVELEAMRVDGSDFFCGLTFPVKKDPCSLIIGGWGGGVCGLSSIDRLDASENETTTYREFKNGQWYKIRLRVENDRISAWIDDKQIVDQDIRGRRISIRYEVELSKPFGIATWQTTGALRNIRIRELPQERQE